MEAFFLIFFLMLLVVFLSALVSGSEAAILSSSHPKIKEIISNSKGNKRKKAKNLLKIKENLQKYITTIVVLNNIINIIGSIYIGVLVTKLMGEVYLGILSSLLTFLIILFAEIIPKIYGERHAERIGITVAKPLLLLTTILMPVNYLLDKLSGMFFKEYSRNNVSEGIIREMAFMGMQEGSINSYESTVIDKVLKLDDLEVYDIMVPKSKVSYVNYDTNYKQLVELIGETGYTRFPVIKNDEIMGLINAKDLFKFHENESKFKVSKILRPIIFAPEGMKLFTLEQKLKKNRIHMAAIVNEHGDFTGIISLEDIIEEVIGEIEDEFDIDDKIVRKISETIYHIKASMEISHFNTMFGKKLPENKDFSTLNGYLINKFDGIPKVNDKVKIGNSSIRVIKSGKKKVLDLELKLG